MKKKLVSVFLVVALVAIAAVGTLAYFTDKEEASNVFTMGNVDITLTEPAWSGTDASTGEQDAPEVYPGEALAKDPTVTNIGKNPCFVRVKVEGLDQFGTGDMMITLRHGNYVAGYDSANWTLHTDGYYYYNEVVATEATAGDQWNQGLEDVTTPLFNQIVMPFGLDGTEEVKPIKITAEAVQAQAAKASWSEVKGMTIAEIDAWFETCGMG